MSTINAGDLTVKDPSDVRTFTMDWDTDNLGDGVTIVSSTWTITALRPESDTALVKDQASILVGLRRTQIRLSAGTLGALYQIDNAILTSESPTQTKERSFFVKIETQ